MGILERIGRSAELASGMADRRGVDFSDRIRRNPAAGTEKFRHLVMQCSACKNPGECEKLQAGCSTLDAAPDYCLNKSFFDRT